MAKKHPGYYLVLLIVIQLLLVFSLHLLARGEDLPNYSNASVSGNFQLVDADGNSIPDHLSYSVRTDNYSEGMVWLCGELQAMINGQWQTIDYTARGFNGFRQGEELTLYFYGGEIKRLRINGPFRILVQIKGVDLNLSGSEVLSPAYHYGEFEASDVVLYNGQSRLISEVLNTVQQWALQNGLEIGPLEVATFNFDRWRFDFQGNFRVPARRVWVSPTGEINWAEIK